MIINLSHNLVPKRITRNRKHVSYIFTALSRNAPNTQTQAQTEKTTHTHQKKKEKNIVAIRKVIPHIFH